MRVLIDTCVVLDYLQNREPYFDDALNLAIAAANKEFEGYISASSCTDLYYIINKSTHNDETTRGILNRLTELFGVADTYAEDCLLALHSKIADYEDAVMSETAVRIGVDSIITRNNKDYKNSKVKAETPSEFLSKLGD